MNDFFALVSISPFAQILAVYLGLIWGSFLNVVAYRLPLEEPIGIARSKCPKCRYLIPWYLNIPVVSYVFLLGKCKFCKARISPEYPIVEILSAVLSLGLFETFGWTPQFVGYAVFAAMLLVISIIDFHYQIIPDELSLSGLALGFMLSLVLNDIGWLNSVLGVLAGGGMFWAVAFLYERFTGREGLGGGDIKLLGMIGAWLGVKSIFPVILISSALGSIVGLLMMLIQKKNFKAAIPFGPFLAASALIFLFWGTNLLAFLFP